MESLSRRKPRLIRLVLSGAVIGSLGSMLLLPTAASATSIESTTIGVPLPYVQQSDCPSGSSLFTTPPGPLTATNTSFDTNIAVPAGTIFIDRFWSWDGYESRASASIQANEQWALSVGGSTSGLTPDIPDGVVSALIIGSLGSFGTPGGTIRIVHSSLVGSTDSTPNSVYPWAFCYRVQVPETTQPPESTKVTTIPSDTTLPDTKVTTTPTSVVSTSVTTVAERTTTLPTTIPQPPTSAQLPTTTMNRLASVAPTNPNPTLFPAPTIVTTTPLPAISVVTTVAPTSAARTTIALTTVATTVAPIAQVEGVVIEAAQTEDLSYTGSSSGTVAGIGTAMFAAGLAILLVSRRRRAE